MTKISHQVEELGLLEAPLLDLPCLEELIERLPLLRLVSNNIHLHKYQFIKIVGKFYSKF